MTTIIPQGEPLLYDKIAQDLNEKMFTLGHIDDLYPVCFTGEENEETFPQVYINDGEMISLRVLPDSTKSLSFFTIDGEIQVIDEFDAAVPMSYIGWMNLQKVGPGKKYDFTNEIIQDSYNAIHNYGGYDININVTTPLEGFSMMEGKAATMRPYSAFKIGFIKNTRICYVNI